MAFLEHEFDLTIRDIDVNSELTNKAILAMFEDIGGFHSNIAGYGLKDIERTKISWVLLHWKVDVFKRIKYADSPKIKIKTWSRGLSRACSIRDFELYDSNGDLCAVGTSKWALIHLEKGLMRITEEMVNKYEPEDKIALEFDFKKLQEPAEIISTYEYNVSRRDIDINNHMHNLCYLDLAYEALPQDVYENNTFNHYEIMYKNPATLYSKLQCCYSKIGDENIVTIKSEDSKTLHAIVKLY